MQKKFLLLTTTIAMALSLAACGPNAADQNDYRNNAYGGNQSGSAITGNDTGTGRYGTYGYQGRGDRINNDAQGFYNGNRMNPGIQYNGGPGNGDGTLYNGNAMNPWAYRDDGFLGFTNTNPNLFPNQRFNERNTDDANTMANMAAKVKGVDDATVVIAGGTAFVALDIDQNMTRTKQLRVHDQVREKLERKMPRYRINLASDSKMVERIRTLGDRMNNGRPLMDFRNDLNDLGRQPNVR
jgi:YhcN/YlaJ family sporulation lipoprotein